MIWTWMGENGMDMMNMAYLDGYTTLKRMHKTSGSDTFQMLGARGFREVLGRVHRTSESSG